MELEQASITIGKKEVCKPEGKGSPDCWTQFYTDESSGSYGYAIRKLSAGILGSPPYWYHYERFDRTLDGCKEIND